MIEQLEGQVSMFDAAGQSGKTCRAPSQATADATSVPSCKPSAKSQTPKFMYLSLKKANGSQPDASWATGTASPGEYTTRSIGDSPSETEIQVICSDVAPHSVASVSTLSQILQANAPEKYFLSAKACLGILRRAEKRCKELPKILKEALEEVVALSV